MVGMLIYSKFLAVLDSVGALQMVCQQDMIGVWWL